MLRCGDVLRLSAALLGRPVVAHSDQGLLRRPEAPSREEAVGWPVQAHSAARLTGRILSWLMDSGSMAMYNLARKLELEQTV